MSIIFSAIVPHPAMIIPAIGKENAELLTATKKSYTTLRENLYASKPDTIIIISPHGASQTNAFTLNLSPEFTCNFKEFGDFSQEKSFKGDIALGYRIKERLESNTPLQLVTETGLDHGTAVPLCILTDQILPQVKVLPLYNSGMDLKSHFEFGKILNRELMRSEDRTAIIASGDLSHSLTKDSPAKYSPKAKKFDQKIVEAIRNDNKSEIINIKPEVMEEVHECGMKSIAMLLGAIDGIKYKPKILSYESPLGIGYLTVYYETA